MTQVSADTILAETITISGHGGDEIEAYRAVPVAPASRAGVVWIHHMPGYDRETKEFVRRLAVAGYNAVCPNLYSREAPAQTLMTRRPPSVRPAAYPTTDSSAM